MKLGNYIFEGPYDPNKAFVKDFGAVYAIIDDHPKVLDVGQTNNINERIPNHDRRTCWNRNKTGNIHLYILVESQEKNRLAMESFLRKTYNPICGII